MRPYLQYLFLLSLIFATTYSVVVAIALPHASNTLDVGKSIVAARSPQPYDLSILGSASSDLALVAEEERAVTAGVILGSMLILGALAVGTCGNQGVPSGLSCIMASFATVITGLAILWMAFTDVAAEEHFAAVGMTAVHTSELVSDTPLLLAEHPCTGAECHELWFHHNSTSNVKKLSVVPKLSSKRQSGDLNDGDPGPGGLFLDYLWNNEITSTEKVLAEDGVTAMKDAAITAFGDSTDNVQYENEGIYCASWFVTNQGFANQGAICQSTDGPLTASDPEEILPGCPA